MRNQEHAQVTDRAEGRLDDLKGMSKKRCFLTSPFKTGIY